MKRGTCYKNKKKKKAFCAVINVSVFNDQYLMDYDGGKETTMSACCIASASSRAAVFSL